MTDWFRSWHGAPTDAKWLVIGKRASVPPGIVSAIVWALFDHASQAIERGDVSAFDFETYAAFSGFDEDQVRAVYVALEAKGLIASGRITAWERRQPRREDTSSGRMQDLRDRRRKTEPELPLEADAAQVAPKEDAPRAAPIVVDVPPATPPISAQKSTCAISDAASDLADEVAGIAGHDLKFVPPSWCGAAARVQMWLGDGWKPPLILESVKAQMVRKRDGPPGSIQYFEKGIARAHAIAGAPLPNVVVELKPETVKVTRDGSSKSALDGIRELRREFADRVRDGTNGGDVRMLPQDRSG